MRFVFTVSLLIICEILYGQQNKNVYSSTKVFNEEGKLQMLIAYDPACSCRTYTEYYADGKIFAKRSFKVTDKSEYVDGEDISYFPDGSIKQYKLWKNSFPEGRAYSNYEHGKTEHEEFYEGKYKVGTWKYYSKTGDLIKEKIYEPGKTLWNAKKESVTINFYSGGKLAYKEVHESGKKIQTLVKDSSFLQSFQQQPPLLDGKKLFELKCSVCHSADKDGYGPALNGVAKRRSSSWLFLMVKNGMQLIEEGDKDAVSLYEKWRKIKHPNFEKLSNKQIESIVNHIKTMK